MASSCCLRCSAAELTCQSVHTKSDGSRDCRLHLITETGESVTQNILHLVLRGRRVAALPLCSTALPPIRSLADYRRSSHLRSISHRLARPTPLRESYQRTASVTPGHLLSRQRRHEVNGPLIHDLVTLRTASVLFTTVSASIQRSRTRPRLKQWLPPLSTSSVLGGPQRGRTRHPLIDFIHDSIPSVSTCFSNVSIGR